MNNCQYYISYTICNDKKKYCLYDSPKFSNQNKYAYLLTFFDIQIEIFFTGCHLMGLIILDKLCPKNSQPIPQLKMLPCGCIVCNDDLHKHIHRITWLKYVKENISTTGTLTISLQGQAFGFTHMNVKNDFGLECTQECLH